MGHSATDDLGRRAWEGAGWGSVCGQGGACGRTGQPVAIDARGVVVVVHPKRLKRGTIAPPSPFFPPLTRLSLRPLLTPSPCVSRSPAPPLRRFPSYDGGILSSGPLQEGPIRPGGRCKDSYHGQHRSVLLFFRELSLEPLLRARTKSLTRRPGVGKTSLLHRYTQGKFDPKNTTSTTGAFFVTKKVNVDGTKVRLQLWDTAGQERFRSMVRLRLRPLTRNVRPRSVAFYANARRCFRQAPMYYRGANAALLLYDITNASSFEDVRGWLEGKHNGMNCV